MTVWEDIQTALTDFWNWLTGVGGGFTDTLGEFGSWLYGGIKWLADQIYSAWTYFSDWLYSGLQWLGDRLKEGYEAIAQWISGGLQWIGSGLSWIGQQLYSFGQWLWNGIIWTARTVASALESFINWLWEQLVGVWNFIVDLIKSWVASLNDHLNDWIKSLRDKFKHFVLVNTAVPAQFKAVDLIVEGKLKEGLLGVLLSPIAGAVIGEVLDVVVPKPMSERVIIFPEIEVPTITPSLIVIEKPEVPATPPPTEVPSTPMYPPAVGAVGLIESKCAVGTSYTVEVTMIKTIGSVNVASAIYSVTAGEVKVATAESGAGTSAEVILSAGGMIGSGGLAAAEYEAYIPEFSEIEMEAVAVAQANILGSGVTTLSMESATCTELWIGYYHGYVLLETWDVISTEFESTTDAFCSEVLCYSMYESEESWES